jgi:hypothetical protein
MACKTVKLPSGGTAIVCGVRSKRQPCVSCGRPASNLCDWKVQERVSGTCDAPVCDACTHSPAPEKDLCPDHARAWKDMLAARSRK